MPRQARAGHGQALAHAEGPGKFFVERKSFALEPVGVPVAHEHQEVFPAAIAGTVQAFVEMLVARIKMMRPGREPGGKIIRQVGIQKSVDFLHHVFGDPLGDEHRLAFQLRGQ